MSSNINLHELLSENPYNLKKVTEFLELDHSSINEPDEMEYIPPLVTVLRNSQCSIDIIRLLLQFGADVNLGGYGNDPLLTALKYFRDEAIIEALLREGSDFDVCDYFELTPLCYIFTDCGNRNCSENFEWKKNVLQLLLQAGLDLNEVIASGTFEGQSHLCLVLGHGADVRDIELLLSKGALLNACTRHATPLHCVTGQRNPGAPLKANVVQLLLDKQARKDEDFKMDLEPLRNALRLARYETYAIRLLIEHTDENAVNTWIQQANLLHLVVRNRDCKIAIVKLFFKRGDLDEFDYNGETVLHCFVSGGRTDLTALEFLLKSGAPVNLNCLRGGTPLIKAVRQGMENYVINLLLAYGARFSVDGNGDQNGICLLEKAFSQFHRDQEAKDVFKTLVKYYFLEFQNFNVQRLIEGHREHEILSVFIANCYKELHRMETKNVRSDCTLRRFISENYLLDVKTDQETKAAIDDCDQLLKILSSSSNEFPEYFDVMVSKVLASKVAEVVLESHLEKLIVFSFNAKIDKRPGKACAIRKVVLIHDVVCKNLAQFLSNEELLRLIVAFYNADDLPYNNNAPKKRKLDSEFCAKFTKH